MAQSENTQKTKRVTNWMNVAIAVAYLLTMAGMGFINQDSSRTIWIVIPFFCLFLPMAWFAIGAYSYWDAKLPMTEEQKKGSIVRMRHSVVGVIVVSAVNMILDIVFILRCKVFGLSFNTTLGHSGAGADMRLMPELFYMFGFVVLIALSVVFAKIYNKYYGFIQ